jgi:hypothetical protein
LRTNRPSARTQPAHQPPPRDQSAAALADTAGIGSATRPSAAPHAGHPGRSARNCIGCIIRQPGRTLRRCRSGDSRQSPWSVGLSRDTPSGLRCGRRPTWWMHRVQR